MTKERKNLRTEEPRNGRTEERKGTFFSSLVLRFFSYQRGFTLVEILIVSTIVSILAAGLGSSFVSGMRLWGRASQQDLVRFNAWLTLDTIARELRQTVKAPFAPITGDARELSFPSVVNGRIVKVTYLYEGYEKRITRKEVGFQDLVEETLEAATKERVVFSPALDLAIEYATFDPTQLDADGHPKGYEWISEWEDDEGAIPVAIRITMKVRNATLIKIILLPIA